MFLRKRTKYSYFNDFTSVVLNFQYDASYIVIRKKIKIGSPEYSLTLTPLHQKTSHFYLTLHHSLSPSKWTSYVYHPLIVLPIMANNY